MHMLVQLAASQPSDNFVGAAFLGLILVVILVGCAAYGSFKRATKLAMIGVALVIFVIIMAGVLLAL